MKNSSVLMLISILPCTLASSALQTTLRNVCKSMSAPKSDAVFNQSVLSAFCAASIIYFAYSAVITPHTENRALPIISSTMRGLSFFE